MATRKTNQFVLNLLDIREALEESEKTARDAIAAGKKAVAASKKAGNKGDLKDNKDTLKAATTAQRNLARAITLIRASCCEQSQGCDPDYV
jgi:hypothetical protein